MSVSQIAANPPPVEILADGANQPPKAGSFADLLADQKRETPPPKEKVQRGGKQQTVDTEQDPEACSETPLPGLEPIQNCHGQAGDTPDTTPAGGNAGGKDLNLLALIKKIETGMAITPQDLKGPGGRGLSLLVKRFMTGKMDGERHGMSEFMKEWNQLSVALERSGKGASDNRLFARLQQFLNRFGAQPQALEGGRITADDMLRALDSATSEDQHAVLSPTAAKHPLDIRQTSAGSAPGRQAMALPKHVMNQVGRRIANARLRGENDIRLQLKPAALGRLQMNISAMDDGIRVSIMAEQSAARDLLLSQVNELKAMLSSQGVNLESVNVEISRQFDQSLGDAGAGARDMRRRGKAARISENEGAAAATMDSDPTTRRRGATLHLVA